MPIRMTKDELQVVLARTQTRIKKLETYAREFLIANDSDPEGELETIWAELEFLQAKEEALLTQISLQSESHQDLDNLYRQLQREIKKHS